MVEYGIQRERVHVKLKNMVHIMYIFTSFGKNNFERGYVTMPEDVKDRTDLGTWGFLRTGWWILHIVGIVVVAYLGYYIFKSMWG